MFFEPTVKLALLSFKLFIPDKNRNSFKKKNVDEILFNKSSNTHSEDKT